MTAREGLTAMARRGLGPRRVRDALRHAGVGEDDAGAVADTIDEGALAAAIAFARRRRIGPFAQQPAERDMREKQVGSMVRAGHSPGLSRAIASLECALANAQAVAASPGAGDGPEAVVVRRLEQFLDRVLADRARRA